jgi:hypothetical protein
MTTPISTILNETRDWRPKGLTKAAGAMMAAGGVGLVIAFAAGGSANAGFAALLTATVLVIGIAMVGPLLSAIFEMSGAKWGRPLRRLAEGTVALMPVGLIALIVLVAAGNSYLPWVHEHPHHGGKAVWLTRGFWDIRVLLSLLAVYGVGLAFVRLTLKRDFCVQEVKETFKGKLGDMLTKGIKDPEKEIAVLNTKIARLAPPLAILYAVLFSLLGFDLIMALEPDWFSTLFGAWYFIGNVFTGLAVVAILAVAVARQKGMDKFLTTNRLSDMATLLLAFCLVNGDFFWNQYLTIWYANLPEETFYVIERTAEIGSAWRALSFVSLATFFFIPFLALLFRKVKRNHLLLIGVALTAVVGVLLARFIEIAPSIAHIDHTQLGAAALTAVASLLILIGLLGGGLVIFVKLSSNVPIMAVGDETLVSMLVEKEGH